LILRQPRVKLLWAPLRGQFTACDRYTNQANPPTMTDIFSAVWSATPTPFDKDWNIDEAAIARLVEQHLRLGVRGLFVAGTCGEGPWLTDSQRANLLHAFKRSAGKQLPIAFQVSDNSAARIKDNMKMAADGGADYVVIAPPRFLLNATAHAQSKLYRTAVEAAPLPVILYDLGARASIVILPEVLEEIYALPQIVAVKDSSGDAARRDIALAARTVRPELRLLCGDEFACDEYLLAGYDGLMTGGAAVTGRQANAILEAVRRGDREAAGAAQARMTKLMLALYGGEQITCWLAGLKYALVRQGVFSTALNLLDYETTDEQRDAIDDALEEFKNEI
jgi:4-hydroxy-tetrahydrodipicolinate synthase